MEILIPQPGGWAMPWSAEEMLDGQRQRVNIPPLARTANNGLTQRRLEDVLSYTALVRSNNPMAA